MAQEHNIEQKLNDLLISRDFHPELTGKDGRPSNADEAKTFAFDYIASSGKNYGTMVIVLANDNEMKVMYGDNLGKTMEGSDKQGFFDFVQALHQFAVRNFWTFSSEDLSKLKYVQAGMAAIKEGLFEGYYGSRRVSYTGEATEARMMIRHNRVLGENDARFRYIESIYIETADQERFKLPFTNMTGARAMLEHVRQGGRPYDVRGNHIAEMVGELKVLNRFNRASAGRVMEGVTQTIVEQAQAYYQALRESLKRLGHGRGYTAYFEAWHPAEIGEHESLVEDIKTMFVQQTLDTRIEAALPLLARIQQQGNAMKEAEIFESWINNLAEGTWNLPETPEQVAKLKELMSQELIVGSDATNATEQLYDLIGDDELFDRLSELAERDPRANVWNDTDVMDRLRELGIETDGVAPAGAEGDAAPVDPAAVPVPQQGVAEVFANPGSGSTGTARGAKRIATTVRKALAKHPETPEQIAARKDFEARIDARRAEKREQGVAEGGYPEVDHMSGKRGIGLDSAKPRDTHVKTFHASKEKEAQEFAKKNGYIVKKHVYPKSANNSQPHEFQVHKNEQGVAEGMSGNVVFSGTGADGSTYEIIQSSPTDFMIHANGRHIDTYGSLQRAMSVLKNEVPGLTKGVAEAVTPASVSKVLRLIQRHHSDWFDTYGMGEVEDAVVDMAEMGQFRGTSAAVALKLVGDELESMYGQQGVAEAKAKTQKKEVVGFRSESEFKTWKQYAQKEGYEIREAGNLPGSYAAFDDNGKRVGYFYNEFDLPNGYYYVGELITSVEQGVAEGLELNAMRKAAGLPVVEGRMLDESGETLSHIMDRFKHEVDEFEKGGDLDNDLYYALFDYYSDHGEIPYGVAKGRDGDPFEWVTDRLDQELGTGNYAPRVSEADALNTFEVMSGFDAPVAEGSCNMTAEGEYCPEHALAECGMYEMGTVAGSVAPVIGESNNSDALLARIKSLALVR